MLLAKQLAFDNESLIELFYKKKEALLKIL